MLLVPLVDLLSDTFSLPSSVTSCGSSLNSKPSSLDVNAFMVNSNKLKLISMWIKFNRWRETKESRSAYCNEPTFELIFIS